MKMHYKEKMDRITKYLIINEVVFAIMAILVFAICVFEGK